MSEVIYVSDNIIENMKRFNIRRESYNDINRMIIKTTNSGLFWYIIQNSKSTIHLDGGYYYLSIPVVDMIELCLLHSDYRKQIHDIGFHIFKNTEDKVSLTGIDYYIDKYDIGDYIQYDKYDRIKLNNNNLLLEPVTMDNNKLLSDIFHMRKDCNNDTYIRNKLFYFPICIKIKDEYADFIYQYTDIYFQRSKIISDANNEKMILINSSILDYIEHIDKINAYEDLPDIIKEFNYQLNMILFIYNVRG